jgi:hypothetical protein
MDHVRQAHQHVQRLAVDSAGNRTVGFVTLTGQTC